jgi:hypothetical protein
MLLMGKCMLPSVEIGEVIERKLRFGTGHCFSRNVQVVEMQLYRF